MPVIPTTQEAEIRRITVPSFVRPYLEKTYHKKGLVEWLKVKFSPQYHIHTLKVLTQRSEGL
jgi:hypothetical protein